MVFPAIARAVGRWCAPFLKRVTGLDRPVIFVWRHVRPAVVKVVRNKDVREQLVRTGRYAFQKRRCIRFIINELNLAVDVSRAERDSRIGSRGYDARGPSQVAHEAEELMEIAENSRELFLRRQSTLGELPEADAAPSASLPPPPPPPPVVTPGSPVRAPKKRTVSTPALGRRPSFISLRSRGSRSGRNLSAALEE